MSVKISLRLENHTGPDYLDIKLEGSTPGDNPRFVASQIDSILDELKKRLRGMMTGYHGEQA